MVVTGNCILCEQLQAWELFLLKRDFLDHVRIIGLYKSISLAMSGILTPTLRFFLQGLL